MSQYKALFAWHEKSNVSIDMIKYDQKYIEKMNLGVSLKGMKNPVAVLKNVKGKFTDFLFSPSVENIVSEKVKDFLEKKEGAINFEFYPVEFNIEKHPSYFFMNILGLVDAFDWEKSDYELYDELGPKGDKVIKVMKRMEIDEAKTAGRRIFVLDRFIGTTYVHESLAKEMQDEGFTGFITEPLRGN